MQSVEAVHAADPSWESRLRSAGLRVTRMRVELLETLHAAGGHRTAAEVFDLLTERGLSFSRATVFNVLSSLVEAQLVMAADIGPGTARYEVADTWHHHFVCRSCGIVLDVQCAMGSKPCLEAALPGALIDEAQVIFRGLCAGCVELETSRPSARN